MRFYYLALVASLFFAQSCADETNSSPVEDGATFVIESGRIQRTLESQTSFGLYSAAASGDRVALLFGSTLDGYVDRVSPTNVYEGTSTTSSSSLQLVVSEDAGRTWRTVDVPPGFPHGIPRRLHFADGKLFLLGYKEGSSEARFSPHSYGVAEFDVETLQWGDLKGPFTTTTGNIILDRHFLRGFVQQVSPHGADVGDPASLLGHYFWETLNLMSGESDERRLSYPYSEECDGFYEPVLDGGTWWAALARCGVPECRMSLTSGECDRKKREICLSIMTPAHPSAVQSADYDLSLQPEESVCVPMVYWPSGGVFLSRPRPDGGFRIFQTYQREGHSYAATLEFELQTLPHADVVSTHLAEGEFMVGRRSPLGETFLADLYLVRQDLDEGWDTRLVRFGDMGELTEVRIPKTICKDEDLCLRYGAKNSHGNLAALLKTNAGYLGIYTATEQHERHTVERYYAKYPSVTEHPISDTAPAPRTDLLLGCESALPVASEFEKTLAKATACDVPIGGLGPHPTSPGRELGPTIVLGVMVENWYKATAQERAEFKDRFDQVGCAAFNVSADLYPPTYPALGSATDCTVGDTSPQCDGDVLRSCIATVDCSELDLKCEPGLQHECGEEIQCAIESQNHTLCQNDFLIFNAFATRRAIDCSEFGLRCEDSSGRCQGP